MKTWIKKKRTHRVLALITAFVSLSLLAYLLVFPWLTDYLNAQIKARLLSAIHQRVPSLRLEGEAKLQWPLQISFGPVTIPGRSPDLPFVRIERIHSRLNLLALLRGRIELAAVEVKGIRVALSQTPENGILLRPNSLSPLARAGQVSPLHRSFPTFRFHDLTLILPYQNQQVVLGPYEASLIKKKVAAKEEGAHEEYVAELNFQFPAKGQIHFYSHAQQFNIEIQLTKIDLNILPAPLRPPLLFKGTGDFHAKVSLSSNYSAANGSIGLSVSNLFLKNSLLSNAPAGPLSVQLTGTFFWDYKTRWLQFANSLFTINTLPMVINAQIQTIPNPKFKLVAHADNIEFGKLINAIPATFSLGPAPVHASGPLQFRLEASGPLLRPADWETSIGLDISRLRQAARNAPAAVLRKPFMYRPITDSGKTRSILIGPKNSDFVALEDLPSYVWQAITISEDGTFYRHQGFDFEELQIALKESVQGKRKIRGASTITQQIAKNLYLSREKTLTRKLREAVITIALEASVPKSRLLEIYLNIAEWGPEIWGIGPAARHWFGKNASELTPREAAFLAAIIPNPVRYHFMFTRDQVSDFCNQKIDTILQKMNTVGMLSDEDFEEALAQPIVFRRDSDKEIENSKTLRY